MMTYAAQLAWERRRLPRNWWDAIWGDLLIQAAVTISAITIVAAFLSGESSGLAILGGVAVAVIGAITAFMKAATPWLELYFKHSEEMARIESRKVRPEMPDSSEADEGQTATPQPGDDVKKARVRRRKKEPKQPPFEASS